MTPFTGLVNGVITAPLPPPRRNETVLADNWVMTTDHYTEKGTVMTVHTAHPGHRFTTKTAGIALAGAVLAAGYAAMTLVMDDAPATNTPPAEIVNDDLEPGLFPGTNREERALMHLG